MTNKSYQLSSTFCLRVITSPSLKPNSPAFSGSKSYKACILIINSQILLNDREYFSHLTGRLGQFGGSGTGRVSVGRSNSRVEPGTERGGVVSGRARGGSAGAGGDEISTRNIAENRIL